MVDGARVPRDAVGLERVPHPLTYRPLPGPRVRPRGGGGGLHPGPRRGVQAEPLGLERGRVERGRGGGGAPGRGRRHGGRRAAAGDAPRRGGEEQRRHRLAGLGARFPVARQGQGLSASNGRGPTASSLPKSGVACLEPELGHSQWGCPYTMPIPIHPLFQLPFSLSIYSSATVSNSTIDIPFTFSAGDSLT